MATVTNIEDISSASTYQKYKDMFTNDKRDLVTMDNFYQLLIAEMQNQDPLEPTSNTEFISQMATFTSLQSMQDSFDTQQMNYANSLVGRTVVINKGDGNSITGVVDFVKTGDEPIISVANQTYKLSQISQIVDTSGKQASAIGDYGAFAAGILGKTAVVQAMDATGETYIDEGVVDSLEIEDGNVRVVVNGYAYDATDVLRVTETVAQTVEQTNDDDDDDINEITAQEAASQAGSPAAQQTANVVETDEEDIRDIEAVDNDGAAAAAGSGTDTDENGNAELYELFG